MRCTAVIAGFLAVTSLTTIVDSPVTGAPAPSSVSPNPASAPDELGGPLASPSSLVPGAGQQGLSSTEAGAQPVAAPSTRAPVQTLPKAAPAVGTTSRPGQLAPENRESALAHGFFVTSMFSYVRTSDDLLDKR